MRSPGTPPGRTVPGSPPALDHLVAIPTFRDQPATVASDVAGVSLAGDPMSVEVRASKGWTLLLFLSSDCHGCRPMWEALTDPASLGLSTDEVVVAVTREPPSEDVVALKALVPEGATCIMSTSAWDAYRVHGPPFFVLVAGCGTADPATARVATEGVAWAIEQIGAEVSRARRAFGEGAG